VSISEERARGRKRVNAMSPTQHVQVSCPTCFETVVCVVQDGLFDSCITKCKNGCELTDDDYDQSELEERAEDAAANERHNAQYEEA
jgi:hypothetical protein